MFDVGRSIGGTDGWDGCRSTSKSAIVGGRLSSWRHALSGAVRRNALPACGAGFCL